MEVLIKKQKLKIKGVGKIRFLQISFFGGLLKNILLKQTKIRLRRK
jgi:hypothetical protein